MIRVGKKHLRILDLDTESRIVALMGDKGKWDLIAYAYMWIGEMAKPVGGTWDDMSRGDMAAALAAKIRQADIVTAHNVGHDLKAVNTTLLKEGMEPLGPVLVEDTWGHLKKREPGWASQRKLAKLLGVKHKKLDMDDEDWEDPALVWQRVSGDVVQHVALRKRLRDLDWLNPPRAWRP